MSLALNTQDTNTEKVGGLSPIWKLVFLELSICDISPSITWAVLRANPWSNVEPNATFPFILF
jgi:hypothetical protein